MEGFIYLHRSLLDWEWKDDAITLKVFIWCLLKANFTDKYWQGHLIKRGSFVTSLSNFSIELNISKMQLRTCIKKLKKSKCITSNATNKNTIITICNYDTYQNNKMTEQQAKERTDNKQITNKQQTNNKQITTTNNDNKVNNENNENKSSESKPKNKYKDAYKEFEDVNYFLSSFEDWEVAVIGEDLLKSFHLHKLQMGCTFNAIRMAKDKIKKDIQNYKRKDIINAITKAVTSGKWLDYYMEDYNQLDFHDKEFYIENYKQGNYELF